MKDHGQVVAELTADIRAARPAMTRVAAGVRELLETGAWQEFTGPGGELVEHGELVEFVTADPPRGLGITPGLMRALVAEDLDTAARLDQALLAAPAVTSAVTSAPPAEAQEAQEETPARETPALRRLREDAPALHSRVVAGEMSTNAAMVQAGFRPKTISVPVSRPETAARALRNNMPRQDLVELVNLLSAEL
ncbi:hypothetical protein [Nonomuraea typhae]|uniref:hypothetical protein n=1 Tax=Nonomuraea typhae TaxID=2603600 RepID=UPI0012FB2597|nr:hypothetical protein [Nonomuraea typhae]